VHKFLVLAVLVIISAGSWSGIDEARGEDYQKGKSLFIEKCQLCHGPKGNGDGPAAAAYNPKPANFADPRFWKDNPGRKITDAMKNGHGAMPPVELKADEIKPIIDYMEHAFKKKGGEK